MLKYLMHPVPSTRYAFSTVNTIKKVVKKDRILPRS